MIGIHMLHRRMAEITHMSMDEEGAVIIGEPELRLLIPLLVQNLVLVRQLDELKNLGYQAQLVGDMDWLQSICAKIDAIEGSLV